VAWTPDAGRAATVAGTDRSGRYRFLIGKIQSSQGAAPAMKSPGIATPATKPTIARKISEMRTTARSSNNAMASLYLENHLDLDRNVHGEPAHSNRRARVLADRLAKDLDHQVGEAVDH